MAAITHRWFGLGVRLTLAMAVSGIGMVAGAAIASGKEPLTTLTALRWQHRVRCGS
jgi:hypothetical protein